MYSKQNVLTKPRTGGLSNSIQMIGGDIYWLCVLIIAALAVGAFIWMRWKQNVVKKNSDSISMPAAQWETVDMTLKIIEAQKRLNTVVNVDGRTFSVPRIQMFNTDPIDELVQPEYTFASRIHLVDYPTVYLYNGIRFFEFNKVLNIKGKNN